MIKWRTEKVRPTYVPTFCVGLDGMCRVLLGRCCRLIEDAVSTIYRAFIFRSAVAPPPTHGCWLTVFVAVLRFILCLAHCRPTLTLHFLAVGLHIPHCITFLSQDNVYLLVDAGLPFLH